jgi:hypothetical protein
MSSTVVNRLAAVVLLALVSCAVQAKPLPLKVLQEPVLGLRYQATKANFDPLPPDVLSLCGAVLTNENVTGHNWVYAKAHDAARTYYVIGGYFEDLHPEPGYPRYERDEAGLVLYVEGTQCKPIDPARDVFDSRSFDEISQPMLRQLAADLAARLARGFGGAANLRAELRNQHVDQEALPPELGEAFSPYFGK